MAGTRIEHDTMGNVDVPEDALWGASTQRAVDNFPLGGGPIPIELVHALGLVKAAAATSNVACGALAPDIGAAIVAAAEDVAAGRYDDQFPVDIFQTGSGTSSNTNANEVIARLASLRLGRDVHPNDAVNASQSSNDVFPTAVHVAVARSLHEHLIPSLNQLGSSLATKSEEFANLVKPGRTHLMDAAPITLGAEFSGYAGQAALATERFESTLPRLLELPLGGTAVGTGLNAPDGFAAAAIKNIAEATGLTFVRARFPFESQSARDALVEVSGQLKVAALSLLKICNDLRWMSSGPNAGFAEIALPALQPGSSIMPGKVNPVIPEAVVEVSVRVVGNDVTVTMGATTSAFELNTAMPLIGACVLDSSRLLTNAARLLADRVIDGISANKERMRTAAEASPAIATALNTLVGYDSATAVVKRAAREQITVRQAAQDLVAKGQISQEQLDEALDLDRIARGE